MKKYNKYISIFLLVVFQCALFPGSVLHELFADHHDTECVNTNDNHIKIEQTHTHCAIFEINAPAYDTPGLIALLDPIPQLIQTIAEVTTQSYLILREINLSSRAPPIV